MQASRFPMFMASIGILLGVGAACGQNYPNKPIRIVTGSPGGGNDFIARILAKEMSGYFGQPFIVENRIGIASIEIVARAQPDGYTVLVTGSTFLFGPLLQKMPFDTVKDFAPISIVDTAPNVLVINPALPVKSVKELIALAKGKPGELNYATPTTGGSPHLAAELLKSMAGINIVHVPYEGTARAMTSLLNGETHLLFGTATATASQVKAGKLRALAVTSAQPSALAPGLPTVSASGLPGYEVITMDIFAAPGGTPATIIRQLNQAIVRVLNQAEVKAKFFGAGSEAAPSSPEELGAKLKSEIVKYTKVIKDAGIKINR